MQLTSLKLISIANINIKHVHCLKIYYYYYAEQQKYGASINPQFHTHEFVLCDFIFLFYLQ